MGDLIKLFWLSFGRWAVQVTSLMVFFFSAAYLSAGEYGTFALLTSFLVLSELSARECIENYLISRPAATARILPKAVQIGLVLGAIFSVFCLYMVPGATLLAAVIMALIPLFQWLAAAVRGYYQSQMNVKKLAILTSLSSLSGGLLAITLLYFGASYEALLAQQLVLWFGIGALGIGALRLAVSEKEVDSSWLGYAVRGGGSACLTVLQNRADILVLSVLFGESVVGLYSFAKRIFQILQDFLVGGLERYILMLHSAGSKQLLIKKAILGSFVLLSVVGASVCVSLPLVLTLLFGDKWSDAYTLFWYMAVGMVFACMSALIRTRIYAELKMNLLVNGRIVELILAFLLIALWGSNGLESMAGVYGARNILAFLIVYISVNTWIQRSRE